MIPSCTINVSTAAELSDAMAKSTTEKNLTININADIDMSTVTSWTPGTFNDGVYTINGNGHAIKNLNGPLFAKVNSGAAVDSKLIIKNLTIEESDMSGGTAGTEGMGAFIGTVDSLKLVELTNCHVYDCEITGAEWTGGLIGYSTGYSNQSDGPVFTEIKITDCSVTKSTITGKGSTGGLIGHATGSTWTKVDVKNTRVIGNTINCTGTSDKKAGEAFGTIGAAGPEDNGKTGGVFIDAIIYGNTTTSNGTSIERIYGRFGNPGTLTINGGNYCDWENGKTEEKPDEGTLVINDAAVFGHDKILSGAKDPTCVEDGYTGDTVCSACGDCFDEGKVIPKLTKHTYKDGKCSVCGAVDPNAPKAPAATDATAATGDDMNMALPIAVAGLALAAMAAVVATRRKHG